MILCFVNSSNFICFSFDFLILFKNILSGDLPVTLRAKELIPVTQSILRTTMTQKSSFINEDLLYSRK